MSDGIESRTQALNDREKRQDGRYVLYWMEHAQRAENNPALERAAGWANTLNLPLLVAFVVDPDYPDGNARHFTFMLQGIKETMEAVAKRGAHFALRRGKPPQVIVDLARNAAVVVTDRGYLRNLRQWRQEVAEEAGVVVEMVEGEVVVPVEFASDKHETAARTFRPKVNRRVGDFLDLPERTKLKVKAKGLGDDADESLDDVPQFVESLGTDASVAPVDWASGGPKAAHETLARFIDAHLPKYADGRSDIVDRHVSRLSPYLHLGQISPLRVLHDVREAAGNSEDANAYVEEMLVRRELAVNNVHYNDAYDKFSGLPGWAQDTLATHKKDKREVTYTAREIEEGKTEDRYFNAAMREMRVTGYLHNYMRMYWGKRIIGWMNTPQTAYRTTLALNNKYFLDGRDTNSFTNVAWLFGLHDRGWPEREVYGKVRVMKPSGLERKFDVKSYVEWAENL